MLETKGRVRNGPAKGIDYKKEAVVDLMMIST